MRNILFSIFVLLLYYSSSFAKINGFDLMRLPKGKNVILPNPAITYVPVTSRVFLSSTDTPQSIKISSVNIKKGRARTIKIAIFDKNLNRVKYLFLKPGMNYLYNFSDISSITVIPEIPLGVSKKILSNYKIKIESDKPLQITR